MGSKGFKSTLLFLLFLIFNSFLAQTGRIVPAQNTDNKRVAVSSDTVVAGNEQLSDVVKTKADNIRNDLSANMTFLNKNAQVNYLDMEIQADYISVNWTNGQIYARGKLNENGRVVEPVVTNQGGKKYETDSFTYNYKTAVAIAHNARTEESEGVIVAERTKKVNDSVFYMRNGKYTTDEYFLQKKDTVADYYLLAPTIKLIKGQEKSQVITGPIQMYIEQVPTPLVLPFAILPFSDKRSAGILIPSFGERQDVGFFLNSLGYYQPIGEHFDVRVLLDLYTKGSWSIRSEVGYKKNYKYSGNFSGEVGNTVRGIRGLPDYSKSSTYRIAWRHQQDPKANPYLNFSASVDIISNKFYNNTINNNYIFNQNVLNTQQNSSVSVTKRFLNLPVTLNGTASYSQNFSTGYVDLRLPQLTANVSQFYLLPSRTGVRNGLLENINVNTSLAFTNFLTAKQEDLFGPNMADNLQTGLKNNIGLSTNAPLFRYFTFSLGANVDNVLTTKTKRKTYNPVTNSLEDLYDKGVAGFGTFSTTASVQTVLYGTKVFKKGAAIQAIRHMITPSFGFTFSPDFARDSWGYYRRYYNERGDAVQYSIFEGGIYGAPGSGLTQSLGFNINNNVEMKVRSRKDSTGVRKIKIFENLNISGSYNFAADHYKWSPIGFNSQSSFFDNKLALNMAMTVDPYKIIYEPESGQGVRTEQFGHFSIQNFNAQFSLPLNEAIFGEKEDLGKLYSRKGEVRNENYYFDDDGYAHFGQPWTLNINAQYNYTRQLSRFGTHSASIGLDGTLKLTPFWNINGSTFYDVVTGELAYTRLGFARDQRSFTINFNWVPVGQYRVYDFFIGIKANILRDAVKYRSRSFPQTNSSF
ncbi:MAG: LPS-assembly protein LptD [Chryseobacterium sp.]|nr:MAG: LPS-assembly protein LptD [Chryseobacterium sp.]